MRKDFFIFGGVNSLDYGVLLDGSGTTTAPERDVMTVTIPGRSGDLLVDAGRWKNTTVSYPCTIAREFEGRFAAFKQALLAEGGYKRLEDTLHPDEYRLPRSFPRRAPQSVSASFCRMEILPPMWS